MNVQTKKRGHLLCVTLVDGQKNDVQVFKGAAEWTAHLYLRWVTFCSGVNYSVHNPDHAADVLHLKAHL